jgi:hypothetical protein
MGDEAAIAIECHPIFDDPIGDAAPDKPSRSTSVLPRARGRDSLVRFAGQRAKLGEEGSCESGDVLQSRRCWQPLRG